MTNTLFVVWMDTAKTRYALYYPVQKENCETFYTQVWPSMLLGPEQQTQDGEYDRAAKQLGMTKFTRDTNQPLWQFKRDGHYFGTQVEKILEHVPVYGRIRVLELTGAHPYPLLDTTKPYPTPEAEPIGINLMSLLDGELGMLSTATGADIFRNYEERLSFIQKLENRIRENDWIALSNGTTFTKTFVPSKK